MTRREDQAAVLSDIGRTRPPYQPLFDRPPFDAKEGDEAKAASIDAAVEHRKEAVLVAQRIALEIEAQNPGCELCSDDIVAVMVERGWDPHVLGKASVGMFRYEGSPWVVTGAARTSRRPWSHGNRLSLWVKKSVPMKVQP